jgi:hypothetical protein
MGLLNSKDYNDAFRRTVAKGTKRCKVVDVRESAGKPKDDGSPVMDSTFIDLQLDEDAKTIDGDVIQAGAVISVTLNTCEHPQGDEKMVTMNRMSHERFRELVVACCGLPANCKDAADQLEKLGGAAALKGRVIAVDWSPSKKGMNSVDRFAAIPAK